MNGSNLAVLLDDLAVNCTITISTGWSLGTVLNWRDRRKNCFRRIFSLAKELTPQVILACASSEVAGTTLYLTGRREDSSTFDLPASYITQDHRFLTEKGFEAQPEIGATSRLLPNRRNLLSELRQREVGAVILKNIFWDASRQAGERGGCEVPKRGFVVSGLSDTRLSARRCFAGTFDSRLPQEFVPKS